MPVITISRKVGSFGEEISRMLAERLGYALVTRADIHRLAVQRDPKFAGVYTTFETELPLGIIDRFFYRDPSRTSLYESLNYELAAQGNVVIQGRGAQIVLGEEPGVFRLRTVAPVEIRVRRLAARKGLAMEEAAELVRKVDRQRRAQVENVFGKDLADWSLYDLVLNTAHMTADIGAEIVVGAVKAMTWPEDWAPIQKSFKEKAFNKMVESHVKRDVTTSSYRDIQVTSTEPGIVVLSGFVQDRKSKELAEKIASRVEGVVRVENRLRTTELFF